MKRILFVLFIMASASVMMAQSVEPLALPLADLQFSCWNTAGFKPFKVCVSKNGNVSVFNSGGEHLNVGTLLDGYVWAWPDSTNSDYRVAMDVASQDSGFRPSVISQPGGKNTFPLKITRTSDNGEVKVEMSFARDAVQRELVVTTTLYNLTNRKFTLGYFCRYSDLDADGSPNNYWWATNETVFALPTSFSGGDSVSITNLDPYRVDGSAYFLSWNDFKGSPLLCIEDYATRYPFNGYPPNVEPSDKIAVIKRPTPIAAKGKLTFRVAYRAE